MNSQIGKLKYLFIGLMTIAIVGFTAYSFLYDIPRKKCDAAGGWFEPKSRVCATPVYLPTLTHRKPGEPASATRTIDFHDGAQKASNTEAATASK